MAELDNIGDHMPIDEFLNCCRTTCFIDYDGFGNLATADKESNVGIKPSMYYVKRGGVIIRTSRKLPKWATHIVWYNR